MINRTSPNRPIERDNARLAPAAATKATGLLAAVVAAAALAGCTTETHEVRPAVRASPKPAQPSANREPAPPSNASNLDPCAMRLHDVAGALFLYYFTNQRMPASLDELNTFPGAEQQIELVCPTSGRPYRYTADGIQLAEQKARVVVYDPSPAHYGGVRWAISVTEPTDDKPMIAKVIALPESFFLLRPPGSAAPEDASPSKTSPTDGDEAPVGP